MKQYFKRLEKNLQNPNLQKDVVVILHGITFHPLSHKNTIYWLYLFGSYQLNKKTFYFINSGYNSLKQMYEIAQKHSIQIKARFYFGYIQSTQSLLLQRKKENKSDALIHKCTSIYNRALSKYQKTSHSAAHLNKVLKREFLYKTGGLHF